MKNNQTKQGVSVKIKEFFGYGIMGFAGVSAVILATIIHIWTTGMAYNIYGLFAAILTLIFPLLSEVYWFIQVWIHLGLWSFYCIAILAYILTFAVFLIGVAIAS